MPRALASVLCPLCDREITVEPGVRLLEALWMHEYECPLVQLAPLTAE
jgi:hypothetical protein